MSSWSLSVGNVASHREVAIFVGVLDLIEWVVLGHLQVGCNHLRCGLAHTYVKLRAPLSVRCCVVRGCFGGKLYSIYSPAVRRLHRGRRRVALAGLARSRGRYVAARLRKEW